VEERRPCKACRCPLHLVVGPNGKLIPLDERSPVYRVTTDMLGNPVAERVPDVFVSHFATCPKANDFSKKGNRK
jgi:hypothetical protein